MKRSAFTLIELIVVIAIIAILSAIIAPNAFRAIEKAKITGTIADYHAIKTAAMAYYADTGTWPAGTTPSELLVTDGKPGWDGPYLEKWPAQNRWGGTFEFDNNAWVDWGCDGSADLARYLRLTNVPRKIAEAIDREVDGRVDGCLGSVWYSGAIGNLYLLISTDVAANQ